MHPSDPEFNPRYHMSREDYQAMKEAEEFQGFTACGNCMVLVPEETLRPDPIYTDVKVCEECLKAVREEISLNRKTVNEL